MLIGAPAAFGYAIPARAKAPDRRAALLGLILSGLEVTGLAFFILLLAVYGVKG